MLLAARRAVALDHGDLAADQALGQLLRVGDGGRAADEQRVGPVEAGDPLQAPQHVGHVAAEDAAVLVHLVHHHVAQVFEELHPQGVVGQDALVQHVRVGDHDVAAGADGPPRRLGRVAVEGEGLDVGAQVGDQAVHLQHLVLAQGLGRKQVQGPGLGLAQDGVQHRQVVAEGLAAGRRRGHHQGTAGQGQAHRLGLVAVQLLDAARGQHRRQPRIELRRQVGVARRLRRQHFPAGDVAQEPVVRLELVKQLGEVHAGLLPLPRRLRRGVLRRAWPDPAWPVRPRSWRRARHRRSRA